MIEITMQTGVPQLTLTGLDADWKSLLEPHAADLAPATA
jgi:hypothetical protein